MTAYVYENKKKPILAYVTEKCHTNGTFPQEWTYTGKTWDYKEEDIKDHMKISFSQTSGWTTCTIGGKDYQLIDRSYDARIGSFWN